MPVGDNFSNNLFGSDVDELYEGLGGFDLLFASLGNDTLDGGADGDVALYNVGLFTNGVFINNTDTAIGTVLAHRVDKRGFGTDTLIDVENFHGSDFDDTIYVGGSGETYTFDEAGDDLVVASQDPNATGGHFFAAGQGNDTLIGTVNRDRVDYRGPDSGQPGEVTGGVIVDLATGVATDGWGFTDDLQSIERVTGTRFSDTILGNDERNDINGLQGDDVLDGRGGDRDRVEYGEDPSAVFVDLSVGTATDGWGGTDTLLNFEQIRGSEFNDTLRGDDGPNGIEGEGGDDLIEGLGDDDNLEGDAGNDTLDGGEGFDVIGHFDDPSSVLVELAAGTATDGWGDTDTLISIEGADGSNFDDTLRGDDGENFFDGREGDDLLEGRGGRDNFRGSEGNDTIDGGTGTDRAEYQRDAERGGGAGVVVDLTAGTATDGFGDTDTLISIEDVLGTQFDDTVVGNDADNYIEGNAGDDSLSGGAGRDSFRGSQGNDTIDGGESFVEFSGGDRVSYDEEAERGGSGGVNVNLATGVATDSFGNTDTLISIEEVRGTDFDDTIFGSDADERLDGEGGDDYLDAVGGLENELIGGDGNDTLIGSDTGADFFFPGGGTDIVQGEGDSPTGNVDHLQYGNTDTPSQGIVVTFTSEFDGTVIDFDGDTDVFTGIEIVEGSVAADVFTGTEGQQEFRGLAGNDTFDGGAGDRDVLNYRWGGDTDGHMPVTVDMVAGTAIDQWGDLDVFTGIERVDGTKFGDTLFGNSERNDLNGREGDDLIDSFGGEDNFLGGGRGNDTLEARGDSDFADGGDGNDVITFYGVGGGANPGLGSDTIMGGVEGFFSIDYSGVGADLVIDVSLGTTTIVGTADVDTFTNIVNVGGGEGNDTLLGNDGERQEFFTSLGDDFIDGRGDENDGIDGDRDWLIYNWSEDDAFDDDQRKMEVDFGTGTAIGELAGNDTFVNIEAVRTSRADDRIIGSDQAYEEYQPMAGDDTVEGGAGIDRINYSFEDNRGGTEGIAIDLAAAPNADGYIEVTDTFGDTDYLSGIEQVTGSFFADTIAGTDDENVLIGIEGDDVLNGRGGDDGLYGGDGTDTVTGGEGQDKFGGRVTELDGDSFTDFSADDILQVFDQDFNSIAADVTIVGDEMRIDTTGDGAADATVTLTNGFTGPVTVEGGTITPPDVAIFSVDNAGRFTAVVVEGAGVANVIVRREGDTASAASVDVTLTGRGPNPANAADVTMPFETPVTLSFAPDQTEIVYQIAIADDFDVEAAEDLTVTLSNPVGSGAGGAEISEAQTFVRILNDDLAPSVRIDGEKRNEDAGEIEFTVSRTGDLSQAITVPYFIASAGGLQGAEAEDLVGGLPQNGSVVIAAGESEATFAIAVAPDTVAELHDDIVATIAIGTDWPSGLGISVSQATGSIRNDDGVPPTLPVGATASNYGDPHIVTLDGLAYDFQAVGEFTLIEAVTGDPLAVQVRFQPVEGSQVASQTTAVATTLGSARVVVDATGSSLVSVDGVSFDLDSAVGGASVGDGEIYFDGEAITLVYANGEQLRIDVFDGFLSTSVSVAAGRDVKGLLGNLDGDVSNDLALRDGTVLVQPVSFADLYGAFADDWRIDDATSLFDYAAGQGTADFTDTGFPAAGISLDDFPLEVVAAAEAAAAGIADPVVRETAILDYLLSGNAEFIEAASVVAESLSEPVTDAETTGAPSIASGLGILVSQTDVTEGDNGARDVSFTVYRTGDVSDALSVDYVVGGTADGEDYEGSMGGSLNFAAGEASQEIVYQVLGDTDVEENETLEVSLSVESGGPVLLSSTASVNFVNDDVLQPEPEFNLIEGTNRSNLLIGTDSADKIVSKGGFFDIMIGREGADQFVFGAETDNGRRERDVIRDYEVGVDQILLTEGAEIARIREGSFQLKVFFEDDRDVLYVLGRDLDAEDLTIVYDEIA